MGKYVIIQKLCSCCENCNKYVISIDMKKSINADSKEHINLKNYIICNPLIDDYFCRDDIDNPPNFSRAFRKNCVQCWDVVNGDNTIRHFNDVHNFNCVE